MKIIGPMAGRGSLLRLNSLTTTKPDIIVPRQLIVYRMVYEIYKVVSNEITDLGFILGDKHFFGHQVLFMGNPTFASLGDYYHLQLRWIS